MFQMPSPPCTLLTAVTLCIAMIIQGCDQRSSRPMTRSVEFEAVNRTYTFLEEVRIVGEGFPRHTVFGTLVQGGYASMSLPAGKLGNKFKVTWKEGGEVKEADLTLPVAFDSEANTTLAIEFTEDGQVSASTRAHRTGLEQYRERSSTRPSTASRPVAE